METEIIFLIALAVLGTSFLSGIFGMAGGTLLLAILLLLMPVPPAMVLHGAAQAASNGWRAVLHIRQVSWPIIGRYCLGAALALLLFSYLRYVPEKAHVFLLVGGVTLCALYLPPALALDATRRGMSELCGLSVNALHFTAGVSGPFLQAFFIKAPMTRHQSVATRAQSQLIGHGLKIIYFALIVRVAEDTLSSPAPALDWELYALVIGLAFAGALGGKYVLDRMEEGAFHRISRAMVFALAIFCLLRGGWLMVG